MLNLYQFEFQVDPYNVGNKLHHENSNATMIRNNFSGSLLKSLLLPSAQGVCPCWPVKDVGVKRQECAWLGFSA